MDVPDGGGFKLRHLLVFLLLGIAPALALHRIPAAGLVKIAVASWATISAITYFVYAWDKRSARANGQRTPEITLHLLELLGGWPGAFVAQHRLRHKTAKAGFQIIFWLIVALHQFAAVDYLRGWSTLRELSRKAGS
jgi:uncharacterized membrane protein YsdA (DUF1294 family)